MTDAEFYRQYVVPVMQLRTDKDIPDSILWNYSTRADKLTALVVCSDLFWWGTADAEEITVGNLEDLKSAIEECEAVDRTLGSIYGCDLFCCRIRKMRPQGCCYPKNKDLWPLFDVCGPEREVGRGNPYRPGERKSA